MSLVLANRRRNYLSRYSGGPLAARVGGHLLGAAARRAIGSAVRRLTSRSGTSAQSVQSATAGQPLTGHYDYKTDYSKRRLSKKVRRVVRRKRRWRNKVIRTVREGLVGSSHILRRSFAPAVVSNVNQSASLSWMMYGLNGYNDPNLDTTNDVGQTMYEASGTAWTNWDSTTLSSVNHKFYAHHATMEVTMVNTGEKDVLVEVYHIRARNRQVAAWASPNNVFNVGFVKQGPTVEPDTGLQVGTQLTPTELGVTPFQNALFCRMFNIFKRRKFRIPVGGEVTFLVHDRRPRTYTLGGVKPFAWDRGTSGVFIQFQGVAENILGTGYAAAPAQMTFNCIRRYRYKFVENNNATDGRN